MKDQNLRSWQRKREPGRGGAQEENAVTKAKGRISRSDGH